MTENVLGLQVEKLKTPSDIYLPLLSVYLRLQDIKLKIPNVLLYIDYFSIHSWFCRETPHVKPLHKEKCMSKKCRVHCVRHCCSYSQQDSYSAYWP